MTDLVFLNEVDPKTISVGDILIRPMTAGVVTDIEFTTQGTPMITAIWAKTRPVLGYRTLPIIHASEFETIEYFGKMVEHPFEEGSHETAGRYLFYSGDSEFDCGSGIDDLNVTSDSHEEILRLKPTNDDEIVNDNGWWKIIDKETMQVVQEGDGIDVLLEDLDFVLMIIQKLRTNTYKEWIGA